MKKHNFRFTIFVDAAYLYRLSELKNNYPSLEDDYKIVTENIKWLIGQGSDVPNCKNILFCGRVDNKDLHIYLNAADVFSGIVNVSVC